MSETPNCSYEFFTVHTDSISSNNWVDANQNNFVSHLFRPLENVVQVSIVCSSIPVSDSNVCYLRVNELTSQFNESSGELTNPTFDVSTNTFSTSATVASVPTIKDKIRGSLAKFNVNLSGRTIYEQQDYSTQTQFITPINRIDRLTTEILDENGELAVIDSNVFISYRFTCIKENLCPRVPQKKLR